MFEAEGVSEGGIMDLRREGAKGEICNRVRESVMAVREALEIAIDRASSKAAAFFQNEQSHSSQHSVVELSVE